MLQHAKSDGKVISVLLQALPATTSDREEELSMEKHLNVRNDTEPEPEPEPAVADASVDDELANLLASSSDDEPKLAPAAPMPEGDGNGALRDAVLPAAADQPPQDEELGDSSSSEDDDSDSVVSSSVESDEVRRNLGYVPLRPNRLGARRGLYSVCCEQSTPDNTHPYV